MIHFYDTLETRSPQVREAELMQALPQQVAHARSASAAWRISSSLGTAGAGGTTGAGVTG